LSIDQADLDRGGLCLEIDDSRPAGCVATVTLNRPRRRNAMTPAMWHGLAAIGAGLPDRVRVVVVRGEGTSFSAGIDLRMFTAAGVPGEEPLPPADDPGFEQWIAACQAGFTWLRDPRIVSVAAVRGHAIGAGCQLALCCDLRLLADDARLCIKEPALGLVPDLTGTKPRARAVPHRAQRGRARGTGAEARRDGGACRRPRRRHGGPGGRPADR